MRYLILLLLTLSAGFVHTHDQVPAPPQDTPIALEGGTIHTVSGDVLENATVLFENGTITAVGTDIDYPANTRILDISGKHVYPGMIAMNTRLGITEIGRGADVTHDYLEYGPITPEVRAEVAFNPDSELIPVTRANGVALAQTVPQAGWGGKRIAGRSALMELDGWTWEEMAILPNAGLHVHWPTMLINRSDATASRENRDAQVQMITDVFDQARAYRKAMQASAADDSLPLPDTNIRMEAILPALSGEMPVFIHADHISQIEAALNWAQDETIKVVLVGARHAWMLADRLREEGIPVVVNGTQTLQMASWEPYDTAYSLPARLHEAGVSFCIGFNGRDGNVRNLPYHASAAAAYGLPKKEALKAVTLYPAAILGIDDRLGSIDPGKDATLIVTDGDPLEIICHVEHLFIQGRNVDLSSRHTLLYDKYRERYQQRDSE